MKPIVTAMTTHRAVASNPARQETGAAILPLPLMVTRLDNGMAVLTSWWQPSEEERAAIAAGAAVRLDVLEPYHPPVILTADTPPLPNAGGAAIPPGMLPLVPAVSHG